MRRYTSVITGFLLLLAISATLYGRDRQAARTAYQKARQYHDQLLQTAKSDRSLQRYRQTIFLYRRVVDHDPTYGACDDALYAVGGLYEEMAQRFENERYRQLAIYYFEFVADQYPLTKHKRGALERAELLKPKPVVEQDAAGQPGVEQV